MTFDMPVARTIVLVFDADDDLPPFVGGIVIRILIGRLIDLKACVTFVADDVQLMVITHCS